MGGVTQPVRVVIRLFVSLIEPWCCVIKFVINKSTCGQVVPISYVLFTCELQTVNTHSNYFETFY